MGRSVRKSLREDAAVAACTCARDGKVRTTLADNRTRQDRACFMACSLHLYGTEMELDVSVLRRNSGRE